MGFHDKEEQENFCINFETSLNYIGILHRLNRFLKLSSLKRKAGDCWKVFLKTDPVICLVCANDMLVLCKKKIKFFKLFKNFMLHYANMELKVEDEETII